MTNTKTLKELIEEAIGELYDDELITLHNEYCAAVNYDELIYPMEEFDEMMGGCEPWEIARSCYYGDFRPCDNYFYFNAYGNLCSGDFVEQLPICDYSEIAEYIAQNEDSLYIDKIQDIIDNYEEVN